MASIAVSRDSLEIVEEEARRDGEKNCWYGETRLKNKICLEHISSDTYDKCILVMRKGAYTYEKCILVMRKGAYPK